MDLLRLGRALCRVVACLTLAGLFPGSLGCSNSSEKEEGKPNFVFILSDDQGWNDIGYNGSEIRTPKLDRMASEGVWLNQHYVQPVCSPTRAALLTGRFPSRFGVLGAIAGPSKQCVPLDVPTLPGILAEHGYATHISGKWHLALTPELGPTHYGFQTSYGYLHGQIDPYSHLYKFGDRTWHRNDQLFDEEGHVTDLITREAVRFIESSKDAPFFLYVAYSVPHYPRAEPEEWTSQYLGIEERSRRLYAASVSHMDDGIGRIIQALEVQGLARRTLVVFSSDNGGQDSWLDTSGVYDGRYPPDPVLGNNQPLRGWKGDVYEGGIRVPAIAYWPGVLAPSQCSVPIHIADWMPTFAALASCRESVPSNVDGQNVFPFLTHSESGEQRKPIYVRAGSGTMLRQGDFKLVMLQDGKVELFNLAKDPLEQSNLAAAESARAESLMKLMEQMKSLDSGPVYWDQQIGQR